MNRLLTLLARPAWRGRRPLPVLFTALLVFAASCGSDFENCPDCPGSPSLIPGSFVLTGADGNTLPYTLPANNTITILAGDCVTTSAEKFTLHLTTVTNGKDTVTANLDGFVLPFNKGAVTFAFSASSIQATALITGDGFALTYNGTALQFTRQG